MSLAAATVSFGSNGPVLTAAGSLPVESLVLGRPVAEVAELLPRVFNICRAAQGAAARLALGLAPESEPAAEVIRDHVLKLCILLPRCFGWPAIPLPARPMELLGVAGLPSDVSELEMWTNPVADSARAIAREFPPGAAASAVLPVPPHPLAEGAFENSAAGRQAHHPLLQSVEGHYGRGPLWRYFGLLADLEAALAGRLPKPNVENGVASVAAARGSYALRIEQSGGLVTAMTRRTPTDHLLAPEGALLQSLQSLPHKLRHLANQVIALHDPCIPVTISEAAHA